MTGVAVFLLVLCHSFEQLAATHWLHWLQHKACGLSSSLVDPNCIINCIIETIPLKWQEEPAGPSAACTQQLSAPSGAGGSPAGEAAAGAREPLLPALAGRPRPRRPAGAGRARSLPPRAPRVSMQQRKAGRADRSHGAVPGTVLRRGGGPWPLQHLDGERHWQIQRGRSISSI